MQIAMEEYFNVQRKLKLLTSVRVQDRISFNNSLDKD